MSKVDRREGTGTSWADLPVAVRTYLTAQPGGHVETATGFTGASRTGEADFDVVQRLEGNFPGGVVDLHYRFALDGPLIGRLAIEP